MSRLDEAAKPLLIPLITSGATVLSKDAQRTIAAWIAMKVMVAEFSERETASDHEARTHVMSKREPPNGWKIWIGRHSSEQWRTGYFRSAFTLGNRGPDGRIRPLNDSLDHNTQSVVLGLGDLVFLAISTRLPDVAFNIPNENRTALRQIWPFEHEVAWPPLVTMDDRYVWTLTSAFDKFAQTIPWAPATTVDA
jgi:hypothetical protein